MQCHDTLTDQSPPYWQVELRKQAPDSTTVDSLSTQIDSSLLSRAIELITRNSKSQLQIVRGTETVDLHITPSLNPSSLKSTPKPQLKLDQRIARLWLDSFLSADLEQPKLKSKLKQRQLFGSTSGYQRAEGALRRFIGALRENLGESLSFFDQSGSLGTFERTLAEIREVIDLEFMRLNSLSQSSGEDSSPDMEMFRSRTESTQHGFSLTSDTFAARAKMTRDFNLLKTQIQTSLKSLKEQVESQVTSAESEFHDLSLQLSKGLQQNETRVQAHLAEFEQKIEEWSSEISESGNPNLHPKTSLKSQKNLDFINLMNKERGFTFGNEMQHLTLDHLTTELSQPENSKKHSRLRGKSSSSEEPTETLLTKCHNCAIRKSKTNFNSLEEVNSLKLLKELKARGADMETGEYIQKLKDQISSLGSSKQFSSGDSDKPGQLNFGFFLMSKGSEDNLSVYDSSMTHRLLDALLDDKVNTTDKWVDHPDEFSKTTNPKTRNLKDFLGIKSGRNLNKTDDVTQNKNSENLISSPTDMLKDQNFIEMKDLQQNEKKDSISVDSADKPFSKHIHDHNEVDTLNDLIHIPTDEEVSQYLDEPGEFSEPDQSKSKPSENKSSGTEFDREKDSTRLLSKSEECLSLRQISKSTSSDKNIPSMTEFQTFETQNNPKIRISKPEIPEIDPSLIQPEDHRKKNPFMATDGTNKSTENNQILESQVIDPDQRDTMTSQTLMESFRRRKQTRLNSFASKRSVSNGPDDWRHRLGGMIKLSKNGSVNENRSTSQNLDIHDFKNLGKRRHLRSGSKYSSAKPKITPSRKILKNTLKSLVFQTGKRDTEMLQAKLEKNQINKGSLAKSSQLESVNETISQIMDHARRTVLLEDPPKFSLENSKVNTEQKIPKNKGSIDSLEKEGIKRIVEEMSRQNLEEKMVLLCQELFQQGLDWKNVEGSLREKIENSLKKMKKAVEIPFEKLVEKHVSGLEDMKGILDKIKIENIQLEYGMIKLSEAYNQIIQSLKDREIRLEIPAEQEPLSQSNNDDLCLYSQEVNNIPILSQEKNENLEKLISPALSQKFEQVEIDIPEIKPEQLSQKESPTNADLKSNTQEDIFQTQSKGERQSPSKMSFPNGSSSQKRFYEQFSLKEFRDEIRERVEFEKSKLDSHLREITESGPVVQFSGLGIDSKAETVTSRVVIEDSRESAETFSNSNNDSPDPLDLKIPEPKQDPALFNSSLNQRLMRHKSFKIHKNNLPLKKRFSVVNQSTRSKIRLEVTPTRTPPGGKRRTNVVLDLGQEKGGNKRRMIKTVSGVIKTVGEMKEEYYNTKKWNVDLLMENQDLAQVNNKLNSQNMILEKEITGLQLKIENLRSTISNSPEPPTTGLDDLQSPQETDQTQSNNGPESQETEPERGTASRKYDALEERLNLEKERYQMLEQEYQELVEQNAQLLAQSKEMTSFWVDNFKKVNLELKETREDLDFLKRELSVELQLLKGKIMVDVVEKLKETNQNLNLFVFMNEKLEKERASIRDCIFKIQAVADKRQERMRTSNRRSRVKTGYMKIGELCGVINALCGEVEEEEDPLDDEKQVDYTKIIYSDLSEYRTNKDSYNSESIRVKTKESSLKAHESDGHLVTLEDPEKITESESELLNTQKSPVNHQEQTDSDVQININKIEQSSALGIPDSQHESMLTERTMNSENDISDLDNYQINYDQSDMGQSSSEEEEFDNGMDVLLKEYMTEQMANRGKQTEGVRPPYNTVQDIPANTGRHKSAKPKVINWKEGYEGEIMAGEKEESQKLPKPTQEQTESHPTYEKIDLNTPQTTNQSIPGETSQTPTSINNYNFPTMRPNEDSKTSKKAQQTGPFPDSKVSLGNQMDSPRNRITLHKIRDDSSIEEDETESQPKNRLSGIYMDRESGFEDIAERLIGVVSLEDRDLRREILTEYRKVHRLSSTTLTDDLDEEMLQSLRESAHFKTKLIEDLPEEKKKSIAIRVLVMLRGRLGNDEDDSNDTPNLTLSQTVSKNVSNGSTPDQISSSSNNQNTTPTELTPGPKTQSISTHTLTIKTSEDQTSSILKANPKDSRKMFSGSRKSKSIKGDSTEITIKLERIRKENNFLVAELEERNKKIKIQVERIENLESQNFGLQEKVEDLHEEVVVYQQRLDFFEKENLTEAGSEYGDGMSQFDMMSQRLSNHMKVIQEEDEEDEDGSLISGYRPSQQNFNFKIDQGSLDNESHFSFYKDDQRSEIDYEDTEADGESIKGGKSHSSGKFRMGQTFIKKIQRRATTRARTSFQKEAIRQHLENFNSPQNKMQKHTRKSVGTFGVALQRKKINKSESLNQSLRNSAEVDLERVIYSQGRTKNFDSRTSDHDSQKISFGKLIESGGADDGSLPGFHSNQTEDFGIYSATMDNHVTRNLRLNSAPEKSPSPIISYISEDKIGSGKFDYSKNFEDHISSEISGKLADLKINEEDDSKRALSEGVITRKAMSPRGHKSADIIKELRVVTVMSFSTGESEPQATIGSSELPDETSNLYELYNQKQNNGVTPENENDKTESNSQFDSEQNEDKTEKKVVGSESRATDPHTVQSVTLVNVDLELDNSRVVQLKRQIGNIKESFVNLKILKLLKERTTLIETQLFRVSQKMERVKRILSRSRQRRLLEEFAQRRQFGDNDDMSRKKGFTNQFDSEPSGEYSVPNTPGNKDVPDHPSEDIGLSGRVLFGEKKDFAERTSHQGGSPFGKKPLVGWQGSSAGRRRSKEGHERLMEIEHLKLRNALETERDKVLSLEQELSEGRQGLERLLDSMPRKVKQSPLLKMGEKHFREVLELVTFQVEEYQEQIQLLKSQRNDVFLKEYQMEDSDEGLNTEELIGSSVLNTRGGTQKATSSEDRTDRQSHSSEEHPISDSEQIKNEYGLGHMITFDEVKRKNFAVEEGVLVREDEEEDEDKFFQNNFNDNLIFNKQDNMIQYSKQPQQIPDSDLRSSELKSVNNQTDTQLTQSELRSRQLYESCAEKRGEILLGRLDKRQQKITQLLDKAEKEGVNERKRSLERAKTESLDIVEEVKVFLLDLEKGGYETEYKNLYGKKKGLPDNNVFPQGNIEFLSDEKEREILSQDNIQPPDFQEFINPDSPTENPQSVEDQVSELSQEDPEETLTEPHIPPETTDQQPDHQIPTQMQEIENDSRSQDYPFAENDNASFENDIDDMIADLLEVIYNDEVDYPEKIKVIKIFLHHTYDLIQAQKMGIIHNEYGHLASPRHVQFQQDMQQEQSLGYYAYQEEFEQEELEGIREDEREDLPSLEFRSGKGRTPYTSEGKQHYTQSSPGWKVPEENEEEEFQENKEDSSGQYEAEGVGEEPRLPSQDQRDLADHQTEQHASQKIIKSNSDDPALELNIQEIGLHRRESSHSSNELDDQGYDPRAQKTPLVLSQEEPSPLHEEMIQLRISQRDIAQKNIILNDEVDLLKQRNILLHDKIADLKKHLKKTEREKRDTQKRSDIKSNKLKQSRLRNETLELEMKTLQNDFRSLRQAAEERAEEWQLMEERLETLKEVNQQLASEKELRSHEYRNSSSFTGLTPVKNNSKEDISPETDPINDVSKLLKWAKGRKSQKTSIDGDQLLADNPPIIPEIRAPANNIEGSEYPQGFGVKRLHHEELRKQQEQIEFLVQEKVQLEQDVKEIQEDAEMRSLKYNQTIQDLKMKVSELREASRSSSRFSFKKKLSSCRTENELRKKELVIQKMRQRILKLQDQLRTTSRSGSHGYSTTPRVGSGSDSRSHGYQRSRPEDRDS